MWLVIAACTIGWLATPTLGFFNFRPTNRGEDPYKVLGVHRSASEHEIKKAFRAITREEHPDLKSTAEEKEAAATKMRSVLRAYDILSNPDKRKEFDVYGFVASEQSGGGRGASSDFPDSWFFGRGFQQPRPSTIESATPTLTFLDLILKVLPYRGPRLFLLQFYSDEYSSCRTLSPVWEALYKNSLAQSGSVAMYRVNMGDGKEGPQIAQALFGLTGSLHIPTVLAITDGKKWVMRGLNDFLSKSQQPLLTTAMQGFVQSFYKDFEMDLATGTGSISDLQSFLLAGVVDPLSPSKSSASSVSPVRVLVSSNGNADDAVAAGVQLDDPKVAIKIVHKKALLIELVTDICGRSLSIPANEIGSIIVLLNETMIENAFGKSPAQRADGKKVLVPNWCEKLYIAPMRTLWRPKTVINFVQLSFIKDSDVLSKMYPAAIPILRSQADFEARCSPQKTHGKRSHFDSTTGKYCAIYAVRNCDDDSIRSVKGKGIIKTFMKPPLWADNRDRLHPFELVGICLDRQPKLLNVLQSATTPPKGKGISSTITNRDLDRDDFIILYDYSEPSRVGLYVHYDIGRGGGLPKFSTVLAAFLEDHNTDHPNMRVVSLGHHKRLSDTFLKEPPSFLDSDNKIIYGHSITSHSLPPAHFPVRWYRWWAWTIRDIYDEQPIVGFVWLLPLYFIVKFFSSSSDKKPSAGPFQKASKGASEAVKELVDIEEDLKLAGGFLILFFPRVGQTKQYSRALDELIYTNRNLMSDNRFLLRQISTNTQSSLKVWRDYASKLEAEEKSPLFPRAAAANPISLALHVVAIRAKKRVAVALPQHVPFENWCAELVDGTITPKTPLPFDP